MQASPVFVRTVPFIIFLLLTFLQGRFGEDSRYWFYLAKTLVGAWLVWEMWPFVSEMRWTLSVEAVIVGVAVCVMWVGIDGLYRHLGSSGPDWNPFFQFPKGALRFALSTDHDFNFQMKFSNESALAWFFVIVRIFGSTVVVPPLEEVFYRSFIYRWIVKTDFQSVPFNSFHAAAFVITSVIFGFEHSQWLAGILCGFAFQWLVIRKNRLGDAIMAHAITNFLLGVWVVWKGAWQFW